MFLVGSSTLNVNDTSFLKTATYRIVTAQFPFFMFLYFYCYNFNVYNVL